MNWWNFSVCFTWGKFRWAKHFRHPNRRLMCWFSRQFSACSHHPLLRLEKLRVGAGYLCKCTQHQHNLVVFQPNVQNKWSKCWIKMLFKMHDWLSFGSVQVENNMCHRFASFYIHRAFSIFECMKPGLPTYTIDMYTFAALSRHCFNQSRTQFLSHSFISITQLIANSESVIARMCANERTYALSCVHFMRLDSWWWINTAWKKSFTC